MSQSNIDQFYAKLNNDPALASSLAAGVSTQAELVERAVAAGQAQGLPFTAAEADAWIAKQNAASQDGELSDAQLEGVAGGKGSAGSIFGGIFNGAVGGIGGGIPGIIGGAVNGGIRGGL